MKPVIRTEGLCKSYRQGFFLAKSPSLWGLDLEVQPGETFGFVGPNGAGKTTTIKLLMGLIRPTTGVAEIFGRPVTDHAVRRRVGFLPERPYFYPYLTPRELVDFAGRICGIDARVRRRRVQDLLERVGIAHAADRRMRTLSKGMMQRAGLAQALVGDPDLLVLDEPMSGLDPIGRREVRDLLHEEKRAGRTVFFSTHILHDVEVICDRVGIVVGGRMRRVGAIDALVKEGPGAYELALRGGPERAADALARWGAVVAQGDALYLTVAEGNRLQACLRWLVDAGFHLERMTPQRPSIEDLFMREAAEGAER